jgi:type I restriction enzyme S subunit
VLARSARARRELDRIPKLIERHKQAILAKAFRGELVHQDPNNEPAAAVLGRIRAARENGVQPKRRRGRG